MPLISFANTQSINTKQCNQKDQLPDNESVLFKDTLNKQIKQDSLISLLTDNLTNKSPEDIEAFCRKELEAISAIVDSQGDRNNATKKLNNIFNNDQNHVNKLLTLFTNRNTGFLGQQNITRNAAKYTKALMLILSKFHEPNISINLLPEDIQKNINLVLSEANKWYRSNYIKNVIIVEEKNSGFEIKFGQESGDMGLKLNYAESADQIINITNNRNLIKCKDKFDSHCWEGFMSKIQEKSYAESLNLYEDFLSYLSSEKITFPTKDELIEKFRTVNSVIRELGDSGNQIDYSKLSKIILERVTYRIHQKINDTQELNILKEAVETFIPQSSTFYNKDIPSQNKSNKYQNIEYFENNQLQNELKLINGKNQLIIDFNNLYGENITKGLTFDLKFQDYNLTFLGIKNFAELGQIVKKFPVLLSNTNGEVKICKGGNKELELIERQLGKLDDIPEKLGGFKNSIIEISMLTELQEKKDNLRKLMSSYATKKDMQNTCLEVGLFIAIEKPELIKNKTMDKYILDVFTWLFKGEDTQTKPYSQEMKSYTNIIKMNEINTNTKNKEEFVNKIDQEIKGANKPCIITRNELTFKNGAGYTILDNPVINEPFNISMVDILPLNILFNECREFAIEEGSLTFTIDDFPLRISTTSYSITATAGKERKFTISRDQNLDRIKFSWFNPVFSKKQESVYEANQIMMWGEIPGWDEGSGHHIAYIPGKGYFNFSNSTYHDSLNEVYEYNDNSKGGVKISVNPVNNELGLNL
jgi:hypothetical protein